jgi:methylation protein EvaC
VCDSSVDQFLDLGRQPLSDAFRDPRDDTPEFTYSLRVGTCASCAMVQLMQEVPRERMFHARYPYRTATSSRMRRHFEAFSQRVLDTELRGDNPFIIEIGCNDGTMLRHIAAAGVRHLGVDPAVEAVDVAMRSGVRVLPAFFDEHGAKAIVAEDGRADVVYAANTICHIPDLASIFRGLDLVLKPHGVVVFEDPYLGDVLELGSFDQIYDEHFFLFSARSIALAAQRFGFELVDVERLDVHGGEVRYTLVRAGTREATAGVTELLRHESARRLHAIDTLDAFSRRVASRRDNLIGVLDTLRREGRDVAGYGATAKSATLLNYCGISVDDISRIYDTTPAKQGTLAPGSRIPVLAFPDSVDEYPEYFVLLAWNHAAEIIEKESAFRSSGGRWITYVPEVRVA